jgi:hypothetical protein
MNLYVVKVNTFDGYGQFDIVRADSESEARQKVLDANPISVKDDNIESVEPLRFEDNIATIWDIKF